MEGQQKKKRSKLWRTFSTNIVLGGNVHSMLTSSHFTQRPLYPPFFFYPSLWKTLKAEMNLWVSGVGLTWAKFVSPGASHKCHRTVLKVKIYLPFCFWMWDPLMGLWRNLGWNEAVTSCSPWSDIAESLIVQLPFHHMKSVCHFPWDSLRDWFTRLSNVIQHQVHRLSCQKFKFWSLFSPLTNSL